MSPSLEPDQPAHPPSGSERSESFLIGLCVVVPGFTAGAAMDAFEYGLTFGGLAVPRFAVWSAFGIFVIACCCYGGWLLAAKHEAENRMRRFLLATVTILICQFILVPFIGFFAVISIESMF
ncbi:hypothetical protein [Luteolibacter arcticus]|nr:hypothetical protein [Luteolibacter arcticus]